MEITTLPQNVQFMLINLLYAIIALLVSVGAFILIDKFLYRNIDFIAEIKAGNIAAAIYHSVLLIFIGFIVASAIS